MADNQEYSKNGNNACAMTGNTIDNHDEEANRAQPPPNALVEPIVWVPPELAYLPAGAIPISLIPPPGNGWFSRFPQENIAPPRIQHFAIPGMLIQTHYIQQQQQPGYVQYFNDELLYWTYMGGLGAVPAHPNALITQILGDPAGGATRQRRAHRRNGSVPAPVNVVHGIPQNSADPAGEATTQQGAQGRNVSVPAPANAAHDFPQVPNNLDPAEFERLSCNCRDENNN